MSRANRLGVGGRPIGRNQAALAVVRALNRGVVEVVAIPQLACHLFVLLIKPFAIIGVLAHLNTGPMPVSYLARPVGVGQRLTGHTHDIAHLLLDGVFRLFKVMDAAYPYHRLLQPMGTKCLPQGTRGV